MAKGTIGKAKIIEKIKTLFGADYIGESGNKHYIWVDDSGERIQIAISLTCPKNPIGEINSGMVFGDGIDFAATPLPSSVNATTAEITQEEKDNLAALIEQLGL